MSPFKRSAFMRPFAPVLLALLLGSGTLVPAQAVITNVDICIDFQTNFTDLGGDWWFTNDDRPARGIWLSVLDWGTAAEMFPTHYTDWVYGNGGCATVALDTARTYLIYTESRAEVNGVEINSYDDTVTPDEAIYIHDLVYTPAVGDVLNFDLPADTQYGQLAVATWAFYRNNAGLAGGPALIEFFDDGCCNGGAEIQASTTSKFIIGHELGHGVGFRRDLETNPAFSYTANEDGCDGDNVATNKHGQVSKEFQSGAAVEGFADFYAAWAWNKKSQNDCVYDRHYSSDFDMDGTNATSNGQVSCEGIPTDGLAAVTTDFVLSSITARDWLEDVINAGFCTNPLTNRGTQYDWLRFWWDMVSPDEAIPFEDLVSTYDFMNPRIFDTNGSTATTSDDPVDRLVTACSLMGISTPCANQDNNGVDH